MKLNGRPNFIIPVFIGSMNADNVYVEFNDFDVSKYPESVDISV